MKELENKDKPINPVEYTAKLGLGSTTKMHQGLTKREYFIAMAMQGLLSSNEFHLKGIESKRNQMTFAYASIDIADLILTILDNE